MYIDVLKSRSISVAERIKFEHGLWALSSVEQIRHGICIDRDWCRKIEISSHLKYLTKDAARWRLDEDAIDRQLNGIHEPRGQTETSTAYDQRVDHDERPFVEIFWALRGIENVRDA